MGKDLTEIVFILDRSGSMSGLEADTIGGFNSMIQRQKKERVRPLGAAWKKQIDEDYRKRAGRI